MREIKYRGWFQGINGKEHWVYGYLLKQSNGNWEITDGQTYWTVDDVGQFTGLHDKNGKEIYEGDIVATVTDKVMTIGWSEKFASFVIERAGWAFQHWFGEAMEGNQCEVIGNIYQHSHFLDGKE